MAALEQSIEQTAGRRRGHRRSRRNYEGMTRDRLYEEAQQRGIDGRSTMSRDELVDALRQAS